MNLCKDREKDRVKKVKGLKRFEYENKARKQYFQTMNISKENVTLKGHTNAKDALISIEKPYKYVVVQKKVENTSFQT